MRPIYLMPALSKTMLVAALTMLLSACGGGTSFVDTGSGESGVGGTGISLVKGNVAGIDGAGPGSAAFDNTSVSAGGQRSALDPDGGFSLRGVPAAEALVLVFTNNLGNRVSLPVGAFPEGGSATVDDVRIDYDSGAADAGSIEIIPPAPDLGSQGNASDSGSGNGCQPQPGENGCSASRGNAGNNQGQGNQGQGQGNQGQGQGNQGQAQGNQGQGQGNQGQGQGNQGQDGDSD